MPNKPFDIKRMLPAALAFFILFWMGDALIDWLFFVDHSATLLDALVSDPRELYMRTFSATLLALLFLLVSFMSYRSERSAKALRQSDELAGIILDSTRHAICVINREGTVTGANAVFLQTFGLKENDAVGASFASVIKGFGVPQDAAEQVQECAATGVAQSREISFIGKDGRRVYQDISSFPIGDTREGTSRVLHVMRDISVRKASENLLQESEARYRAIFENSGTAVAIVLPNGMLHMVNSGFEAITGFGREELEGKRLWSDFVSAPDAEAMKLHRQMQQGEAVKESIELQIVDRSGRKRAMAGTLATIAGTDQAVLSLLEITTQKQAEEELRESRATLAVAQRMARLGNWSWDLTTDTLTWSEEMYRLFGVDEPEGFTPTHEWLLQAVVPEDREMVIRSVNDAIYNRKLYDIDFRIIANGAVRTIAARGEVTYDAGGTPLRMVGTNQDVSWRIEAEQALRSSEEKFSKAFRASPDSIVITRAEDGTYIDVNQAFEEVTGYRRDEVIGKTSTALGLWADPDARMVMLKLLNQYGHVRNLDVRFRVKSGEIRELLWSAEVIEYRGEACLIAISRDVTEQRHLEKELLESDARLYMKHEELKNLFHQMEGIRREWEETMDCISDMFILADQWGKIRRFNRAVETFSGKAHRDIVGRDWVQFLEDHGLKGHLENPGVDLLHPQSGKWFILKRYGFPNVEVDGSTREVIIINDTSGTVLRSAPPAPDAAAGLDLAH